MPAPVTSEPPDGDPAELGPGAGPAGGADPARAEGGQRPLQQEVLRDEGAAPAHHAAEPREHEAEGLAPGPRMADLTLDLQPARTFALPLICRRTIMPMHVSR